MGSRVLLWCVSCMSAICSACLAATVEVAGTDEGKGIGLEQGSVAKVGEFAPENQFHFQGDKEGRQAGRTVATCLKVDRPRGAWGRKWGREHRTGEEVERGLQSRRGPGKTPAGQPVSGAWVLNSTLRGRFIGVTGKAYKCRWGGP